MAIRPPLVSLALPSQAEHTVILNWNEQTPLVLQALAKGRLLQQEAPWKDPFYLRPVTVLADKAKVDMDAALAGLDLEVGDLPDPTWRLG